MSSPILNERWLVCQMGDDDVHQIVAWFNDRPAAEAKKAELDAEHPDYQLCLYVAKADEQRLGWLCMSADFQTFAELEQLCLDEVAAQVGVSKSRTLEEIAIKMALRDLVTKPLAEELKRL